MMQVRSLFGDVVERWPLAEGKNIFLFLFLFFIEICELIHHFIYRLYALFMIYLILEGK